MFPAPQESLLLALPDAALLKLLFLAADDDQRSLFSAARAHSKLHQAAALAASSVTGSTPQQVGSALLYLDRHGKHVSSIAIHVITQQEQVDSILQFLDKHGQHVSSISLQGDEGSTVDLRQLPHNLQALSSLRLHNLRLQMLPGSGAQGVLGAAAGASFPALTHLQLSECKLLDGGDGLAAALEQLPGLQHLAIRVSDRHHASSAVTFATGVLQPMQQLTCLELSGKIELLGPDPTSPTLQPLQALTRLRALRVFVEVDSNSELVITASMLAGAAHLTRLELELPGFDLEGGSFDPGALAGKSQLQHLHVGDCIIAGGAAGEAQLLSRLQQCTQLTYLGLPGSLTDAEEAHPPAAAYSALTASSRLQHLDISCCTLPVGVLEHMFPPGRQLLHLTRLDISDTMQDEHPGGFQGADAAAPGPASLLVSCCPGLRHLNMRDFGNSAALLPALSGLSQLHTLLVAPPRGPAAGPPEDLGALAQLTGLRELHLHNRRADTGLLLQLTALTGLTQLKCNFELQLELQHGVGQLVGQLQADQVGLCWHLATKAPGDEPVWRQLLRRLCDISDPAVAQQAAAALEAE